MENALPGLTTILTVGAVTSVVVWGLLEVVKMLLRGWKAEHEGAKTPWYWSASLRLAALILGAVVGGCLFEALGTPAFPWGSSIGAGAGALCTIIVAAVKTAIKRKGSA